MNRNFFGLPPGRGNKKHSCIIVQGNNGYGAVGNKIRRFTNVVMNDGDATQYIDDAQQGSSFLIKEAGNYIIVYTDSFSSAGAIGLSLNSTALSTSYTALTLAEQLGQVTSAAVSYRGQVIVARYFQAGSIIRPHTEGLGAGDIPSTTISIMRL